MSGHHYETVDRGLGSEEGCDIISMRWTLENISLPPKDTNIFHTDIEGMMQIQFFQLLPQVST